MDADPQCNLSTQLLGERSLDALLDQSDNSEGQTLWSLVSQKRAWRSPISVRTHRSALALIPGDVRMYRYEEQLALAWSSHQENPSERLDVLTRLGRRLGAVEDRRGFQFVLCDTAPSLGALNRNVVLESDFIVIPVGLDLFSARGLKTLGRGIVDWMEQWSRISRFARAELMSRPGEPVLAGYVIQRVPTKSNKQARQAVARLQTRVREDLLRVVGRHRRRLARGREVDLRLGSIPEFPSMPTTQEQSEPIWKSRPEARSYFEDVADRLVRRIRRMR